MTAACESSKDREIIHLRELLEVKEASLKLALELQAKEYERRLEDLNHAHAQARKAAEMTVSRDVYEADRRVEDARREAIAAALSVQRKDLDTRLTTLHETVIMDTARRAGRAEIIAAIATILSVLIPLATKWLLP